MNRIKFVLFSVLTFILLLGGVRAQDNKYFYSEWSALEGYISLDIFNQFEVILSAINAEKMNDDVILTSIETENSSSFSSVIAVYNQKGVEKCRATLSDKVFVEVATDSMNIYALTVSLASGDNFSIIKYDSNLNVQKEIFVSSNIETIIDGKLKGLDLFQYYDNKLFFTGTSFSSFLSYDTNLNFVNEFSSLDDRDILCELVPNYCSMINSNGPEFVYGRAEKDKLVVETGHVSSEGGLLKIYDNGQLVFEEVNPMFTSYIQPQIIDDNIVVIGVYDFWSSIIPMILCFDFEGNMVDGLSGGFNFYNVDFGNSYLSFSLNYEDSLCPSYLDDNCFKFQYDFYNKNYIGGPKLDVFVYETDRDSDVFYDAIITSDGGYIAVGYDDLIIKFNSDNTVQWDYSLNGSSYEKFYKVIETSDKGFVVVGESNSTLDGVASMGSDDAHILKLDKNGKLLWSKRFGGDKWDYFKSVIEDSDGNYVAVGHTSSSSIEGITNLSGGNPIIVKYDSNGNIIWKKVHSSDGDNFFDIIETPDGGYLVAGFKHSGGLVVRYDSDGEIIWEDNVTDISVISFAYVEQLEDDNFLLSFGGNDPGDDMYYYVLVKYDDKGNVISKDLFDRFSNTLENLTITSNGGFTSNGYSNIAKSDKEYNVVWNYVKGIGNRFNSRFDISENEFLLSGSYNYVPALFKFKYVPIIRKNNPLNGKIDVELKENKGIITLNPDEGYEIDVLTITNNKEKEIDYHEENGVYVFDAVEDVKINVSYKEMKLNSVENPNTAVFIFSIIFVILLFSCYLLYYSRYISVRKFL